jgi:hypothetical protein
VSTPAIKTPQDEIFIDQPSMKVKLIWNTHFQPKWQGRYTNVQKYVDSEVLRLCEPFIPLLTGMLIMSGILGTDIGSGVVSWTAPYARYQYYLKRGVGTQTGPLRGPHWFVRMKAVYKGLIIAGAQKIAGGG